MTSPAPSPASPVELGELDGLTSAQVNERVKRGETNRLPDGSGRSVGHIVRANVLTPFNFLLGGLTVAVLATGSWRDALFGLVLVFNTLIGIVQEVRAKRTLDHLAVLNAPRARAVRNGEVAEVATEDVVLDDLLELRAGDQVAADGVLLAVEGLEVDESLLTGESDHVVKRPGDEVFSGSFVVVGSGRARVTGVGAFSFASRMTEDARRYTTTSSELMNGINRILKYVAVAVVVVGPLLFVSQSRSTDTWQDAVQGAVAGLVGMVPEGLVLLTSVAFFATALGLAKRRVLVQELPAVEGLARVDVVCVDKTGTLTEGDVAFDHIEPLDGAPPDAVRDVEAALGALASRDDANATLLAVRQAYPAPPGWERTGSVAFSSDRKWSAAAFDGRGTWVLGAPEMVRPDAPQDDPVSARASELAADGSRTLLVARTAAGGALAGDGLPQGLEPVAFVVLHETLRPDAAETLRYFAEQDVEVKVLSGDNPRTVGAVARRVGVPGADDPVDARRLPEDPAQLGAALEDNDVFGRVVPEQKRSMVLALQSRGHTVAMTGDGVNDVLALKSADIGVAMGSGAAATRSVAQLVLLDNQISVMPRVVAEGRRVIANVERVAVLFLTKNVSSLLLSIAIAVARWPYPFLPRQVTLVSSLAIGIPGFFLALGPNSRRFRPGFVRRVLGFAGPAGVVTAAAVMIAYALARAEEAAPGQARTAATIVFLMTSLWVLAIQARPLLTWKIALVGAMAGLSLLAFVVPGGREFFELRLPSVLTIASSVVLGAAAAALIEVLTRITAVLTHRPPGDA
ncbi:MAG: cation-transporting P-type ATPase [Actinomycetota bacterium]|nr:cation-transporting P-type ATPase [Actinomycetota bacterium]